MALEDIFLEENKLFKLEDTLNMKRTSKGRFASWEDRFEEAIRVIETEFYRNGTNPYYYDATTRGYIEQLVSKLNKNVRSGYLRQVLNGKHNKSGLNRAERVKSLLNNFNQTVDNYLATADYEKIVAMQSEDNARFARLRPSHIGIPETPSQTYIPVISEAYGFCRTAVNGIKSLWGKLTNTETFIFNPKPIGARTRRFDIKAGFDYFGHNIDRLIETAKRALCFDDNCSILGRAVVNGRFCYVDVYLRPN